MKKFWMYTVCSIYLMAACTGPQRSTTEDLCIVDVAGAMENQTELKISELGSDVCYIPLETTDSCLIGNDPKLLLLNKHIVVYTRKDCFLFNKADGKFISKMGYGGDSPEAYSDAKPIYNDVEKMLYFKREPNIFQRHDLQGKYQGKTTIPTQPVAPSDFIFTDSLAIGHYNNLGQEFNSRSLVFFDTRGEQKDTLSSLLPVLPEKNIGDIKRFSIQKQGLTSFILMEFKDGSYSANITDLPFLWKQDGKVRFKEGFIDTIYTVERNRLVPVIAFSTGKWHWGVEARTDSKDNYNRLLMTTVFETNQTLFFQSVRGIYSNEQETFNGVYDCKAGTTRMYPEKAGFVDDLNGFMVFRPQTYNSQGEYGMMKGSDEVLRWLEEHPEMVQNKKLAGLKKLDEDSNPVVVITLPRE
ncbi:DUF4934 domain-containing protein [Bacteroides sp.]|uniref:DUF4934 domain-containing protein n=1 Tax=Bacteroides sp. TaxID=29523 RepID=UPI002624CC86|nr:DUF4934 domain-containing protein [Bacteroides sp.]MDD3039302.1 DUF4934 domain-containing protein [Bacteroides sp.]